MSSPASSRPLFHPRRRFLPPQNIVLHAIPGDQDLPEKEELGHLQLQTVVLPLRDASHAVRESV